MTNRFRITLTKHATLIYFILLFFLLLGMYARTFNNPPRSDYWSAFYEFQRVGASTDSLSWLSILNYDPWRHGTYRPFAYLIIYLEHLLFGANFIGNHILSFLAYFLSIILLYCLASALSLNRVLTAAFLVVYAFLFSHFDIITWSFHINSILGFCAFLGGFILYLKFLRSNQLLLLLPVTLLFLSGMFCYEVYALWPLSIVILSYLPGILPGINGSGKKQHRILFIMLGVIYFVYIAGYFLSRAAPSYMGQTGQPSFYKVVTSALAVFFNFFYNGIMVNLIPLVAVPATVRENINMGGLLLNWFPYLNRTVIFTGIVVTGLLTAAGVSIFRKRRIRVLSLLAFLMFLLFTNFFTVTLARSTTNPLHYIFTQFRYQYVPNALVFMMMIVALNGLVRPNRREKIIICCALIPILFANIYVSNTYVRVLNTHLAPLNIILSNIKTKIKKGEIDERAKLYIEEGITGKLPLLCWNIEMGRYCMRGTYQWMFSKKELQYFAFSPKSASWIIKEDDYKKIYKNIQ